MITAKAPQSSSVLFGWLLLHEEQIKARMTGMVVLMAGAVVIGLAG